MKRKSKFFRVAVEGATTDGRKIERKWLTEIAQTYDPQKYGARVFIEHIRGLNPEWGFRAMGDVVAVKTEEVDIDGEKRLAL
ncbi:GPO family capsid scaffolding protein, partial [Escherichia coli]|uniref:GPO family capsid scaffolding protein n=2 Tax=Enterobacteriaceae TaxID=543 RepID=UPI0019812931